LARYLLQYEVILAPRIVARQKIAVEGCSNMTDVEY
jgi:hypothetical protein